MPLGYLRKGALSDFDLVDDSGVAIPSLGTGDNGRIEQEALKYLGEKAGLDWTRNPDLSSDMGL